MLRDLGLCVIIVAVSSTLAVATNLLRERPLTWIREKLPESAAPATVRPTAQTADEAARGASDARPAKLDGETSEATSGAVQGVVMIDEVLEALATGSAYFIDAREPHEYAKGYLRGALHLPSSAIYQNIEGVLAVVPMDARVIVYCGGGQCEASHNVKDALRRDFGYSDVVIYEKGWEEAVSSDRFGDYLILEGQP